MNAHWLWDTMRETPAKAVLSTVIFSALSVAVFYLYFLWKGFRKIDHKLFRTISFTAFSIFAYVLVAHRIKITKIGDSWIGLLSTIILFIGPIVQETLREIGFYKIRPVGIFNHLRKISRRETTFNKLRALFFGPFGEEMIFRAFACTMWEDAHISKGKIIFYVPFIFGLSHFHHFFISTGSVKKRLIQSIVQILYTTVFGWYVTFLWCRYHSYITLCLVHSFCNFMQLPEFGEVLSWDDPTQKLFIGIAYLFGLVLFVGCLGYMITTN